MFNQPPELTPKEKYTFDDLLIKTAHSDIYKIDREINTITTIGCIDLTIPIISAAMTTVTERRMQEAMLKNGGLGIHHRYGLDRFTGDVRVGMMVEWGKYGAIAVSPSTGRDIVSEVVSILGREEHGNLLSLVPFKIDVAHGDRQQVLEFAEFVKSLGVIVWSGNVATPYSASYYADILDPDTDALVVGIGPGKACTTRIVSGCGYPQASAVYEISKTFPEFSVISDGGIKYPGDITKAIALGARAVIIGGLLAGTDEAPGRVQVGTDGNMYKYFEGMASESALQNAGKKVRVEGVSGTVPYTGSLAKALDELVTGLKLGMSYTGSRTLDELRENAEFIRVTNAGILEGKPRI